MMDRFKSFKEWLEEAEMDPKSALQVFGLADFPKSMVELKSLYKKLAMNNHPDRGGSLEMMKDINLANEVLKRNIGRSIGSFCSKTASSRTRSAKSAKMSASGRKPSVKARKKDFETVFSKASEVIVSGKWRFIKFKVDGNGCPCYLAVERFSVDGESGWTFAGFARSENAGRKTTMKLYGSSLLIISSIVLPDTKDCVTFFANLIDVARSVQNEREIAAYANKHGVKLLEPR